MPNKSSLISPEPAALTHLLSVAMMCKYSLDLPKAANSIETAVSAVLEAGDRTSDIFSDPAQTQVGCVEMSELVLERL
mgnify:CR=1 FL=1